MSELLEKGWPARAPFGIVQVTPERLSECTAATSTDRARVEGGIVIGLDVTRCNAHAVREEWSKARKLKTDLGTRSVGTSDNCPISHCEV